jgi:hypothetical protein
MLMLQEAFDADELAQRAHGGGSGSPEKIHADAEQDGVEDAGYQDPFPDAVFGDELVCLVIRLEGYDDFFQQVGIVLFLCGKRAKFWQRICRIYQTYV